MATGRWLLSQLYINHIYP